MACAAGGTSEDVALLMADAKGASLIVAVGTHNTLDEFLDKGRAGYASTWLTRLRVGSKLVDAKGVSRLYRQRISGWALMLLVLAACTTILVVMLASPAGQIFFTYLGAQWDGVQVLAQRIVLGQPPVIDFRYHLVSIVAVFLALAIGIVVGSTALKPAVLTGLQKTATAEKNAHRRAVRPERAAAATSSRPPRPTRRPGSTWRWAACWTGQRVVLVTAPGLPGGVVAGVSSALHQAGAIVTGQVQLQSQFFTGAAPSRTWTR